MWVVRDNDSTIYITGTVHRLRDEQEWRSAKLEAALDEATDLWLELAETAAPEGLGAAVLPILEKAAVSDGPPLSTLLTEQEFAELKLALVAAGAPQRVFDNLDRMQPWYATYALSFERMAGSSYKSGNGIDVSLARMAVAQGDRVHGMEEIEDQIALITGATPEEQLDELRDLLSATGSQTRTQAAAMNRVSDLAFGSWLRGETHMVEALVALMGVAGDEGSTDALLDRRNRKWAEVVRHMLAGQGVALIAVGAAHLVGPDSLQVHLKARGIEATRY